MPFSSPMFLVESLIAFFILYFPLKSNELRDLERVLSLDFTSIGHAESSKRMMKSISMFCEGLKKYNR